MSSGGKYLYREPLRVNYLASVSFQTEERLGPFPRRPAGDRLRIQRHGRTLQRALRTLHVLGDTGTARHQVHVRADPPGSLLHVKLARPYPGRPKVLHLLPPRETGGSGPKGQTGSRPKPPIPRPRQLLLRY